jgi:hypothetical protein
MFPKAASRPALWGATDRRYQLYGVFGSLRQEGAKDVQYENIINKKHI